MQKLNFSKQKIFQDSIHILMISLIFGLSAFVFSLVSIFVPERTIMSNPLEDPFPTSLHIFGHFIFGASIGLATLKIKYTILSGILPVILDSDHFINFLNFIAIERTGHSFFFALISFLIIFLIFKRDRLIIGTLSTFAIFSHISFDILRGDGGYFPLFFPFYSNSIFLADMWWIIIELIAFSLVFLICFLKRKQFSIIKNH